ncbi:PREDICTED: uncharacterized protein LOC104799674 [Tarenaya hassleriana]|uniref:uncharacterized protein LOC104799674 n=1 Tax=Tarenaya hassleriana TaxID=28532 RepID=UPI00053C6F24|nr:PREDICTED: uncharacterized protein LOC104799674 [Tarenaya hassleriana]
MAHEIKAHIQLSHLSASSSSSSPVPSIFLERKIMDGFGYGGFSGSSYPYWPPTSYHSSNPVASAPPFTTSRPVESNSPIEELSGPMNFYGYSHRSPADWPFQSAHIGVVKSQPSSSSFYADNTRPESCGSRGEDSYKGMFSPSGMFTSREVSSVGSVHANENLFEKHRSHFVPSYNSANLVSGSSSTFMQTCYSQEPSIHPHHACYNDFETAKAVSSYPVEPDINNSIAPLPLSSLEPGASFDDTQIRFHLGYGEPLPSNSSVSKDVLDNNLGVKSSLQSSCIEPVNFDALLISGEATGHSKPLSAGLDLHNPTIVSPCCRGPRASQSPAFDIKSSDSPDDNKLEEGSFVYPRPTALVGDIDKEDALGCSSKNTCENSKPNEIRYWGHFMVADSVGPSVSKLLSEQSQSCDAMRVEYGNAESTVSHTRHLSNNSNRPIRNDVVQANPEPCRERGQNYGEDKMNEDKNSTANESRFWDDFMVSTSWGPSASKLSTESQSCDPVRVDYGNVDSSGRGYENTLEWEHFVNAESAVSHKTCFLDDANNPGGDDVVQANPEPCKNGESIFSEDKMNMEKKATLFTNLGLKERRSEAYGASNCSFQDLTCPTSSPQVSLVVNAMQNLSELLVCECSDNGSRLKQEDLETLEKVVKNLTKCLKGNTRRKTEAGEASVWKQAMPVSSSKMVKLHEVPNEGTADFQGHYVNPLENRYGGYAFTETVNKDEMTQNIKSILASNFPDDQGSQPQALLFKNLWLEAEAALCSTTYMARFYRISNEIENHKLLNKESSSNASSSGQQPSVNLQKSVPVTKNPEPQTTESLAVDESLENNGITTNHLTGSWGLNSDSVDALLALISGSFSGSSEQGSHGKLKHDANCGKIPSAIPEENPTSNTSSHVNDVIDRFQILENREVKHEYEHGSLNCLDSATNSDSDKAVRLTGTDRGEKSGQMPQTPTHHSLDNPEASGPNRSCGTSHANDVMKRFQILKRREAENEQKSLNRLDSDSDKVIEPTAVGNKDHSASETCEGTEDVKEDKGVSELSGRGYENTLEWEHVYKDEFDGQRG